MVLIDAVELCFSLWDALMVLIDAEKFLKVVLDVPFAFKRVEAMLYIANFESEVEYLRKSFGNLEVILLLPFNFLCSCSLHHICWCQCDNEEH